MSIHLFTDFGSTDLYVGQVKSVLSRSAPHVPIIDLLNDAPSYDIEAGAHLLSALTRGLEEGDVVLAVVDPGVGGSRQPAVAWVDGKWFVGPDNGLLSLVVQRAHSHRLWHIKWRPDVMSDSFHGRDLFAPIAGMLANAIITHDKLTEIASLDVLLPLSSQRIVYVDHYGNCMTSLLGAGHSTSAEIECNGCRIPYARIFENAKNGRPFWYINSLGLIEIAIKQGNAASSLGIAVGTVVRLN